MGHLGTFRLLFNEYYAQYIVVNILSCRISKVSKNINAQLKIKSLGIVILTQYCEVKYLFCIAQGAA